MAAIDPSAELEEGDANGSTKPRATLKIIREAFIPGMDDYDEDDSEDDFDEDEMNALLAEGDEDDSEDDEEDEEVVGGPSDPAKSKKARKAAAAEQLRRELTEQMELDGPNGTTKSKKGKAPILNGHVEEDDEDEDEDDDEDIDDDDDEIDEPEEFVICTLDPEKVRYGPRR